MLSNAAIRMPGFGSDGYTALTVALEGDPKLDFALGGPFRRLDGDVDFGAGLEPHFFAVFVDKGIFDSQLTIEMVGPFDVDLGLLRFPWDLRL
jgi:hypothetical protein